MDGLLKKIESNNVKIGVIGMGYVGLPLAIEIAKSDIEVAAIDIDEVKVNAINLGRSYVPDVSTSLLNEQVQKKRLKAFSSFEIIKALDAIIICVPTPLNKTKDPDLTMVVSAVEKIIENRGKQQLIVLESTTYPGTTEEMILPRLAQSYGKVGRDFYLAFSPERIDPGNKVYNTYNTPKVIGGITSNCVEVATKLYSNFVKFIVPVSSPRAAEMVKLLENTFRSVNIGLVNEIAMMCSRLGVDVWEVIDAASSKPFGFMPFKPGPGLGGHCIPVDPLYLSWKLKTLNYRARFIELASEINGDMPRYVVNKINEALNGCNKSVRDSKVFVVGVSYKKDINDLRESPAIDVIHLLKTRGAEVFYYDPYVDMIQLEDLSLKGIPLEQGLTEADCTIIITDHSSIDYQKVVDKAKLVVDTRNATKGINNSKIFKL
ncbi:MAG: nucleotide sugar dehydrogenase [Acidobacteriia bacterium]|jgi:UDP-N-acetyl-D-glucosamine dehydrogenase|nr:nucleotide sugar dehydrogenase [Terriglobia bacterium]